MSYKPPSKDIFDDLGVRNNPTEQNSAVVAVICEGDCEEHTGEIKKVRVVDEKSGYDWGCFNYCESAIQEDKNRGFKILSI